MLPVLAGYISYSIAGKPGLVPGFLGGYLSDQVKAGFLGSDPGRLVCRLCSRRLKKIPVSKHFRPIMPILVIPILSGAFIGVVMIKVTGSTDCASHGACQPRVAVHGHRQQCAVWR